jgi:hypothetical protein
VLLFSRFIIEPFRVFVRRFTQPTPVFSLINAGQHQPHARGPIVCDGPYTSSVATGLPANHGTSVRLQGARSSHRLPSTIVTPAASGAAVNQPRSAG